VPLTPLLKEVLKDWFDEHPGGPFLFCHGDVVSRSKKRCRTTGHKGEKTGPSMPRRQRFGPSLRSRPAWGEAVKQARRAWSLEFNTGRPLRHYPATWQHLYEAIDKGAKARLTPDTGIHLGMHES
jgi:hypothetical protein